MVGSDGSDGEWELYDNALDEIEVWWPDISRDMANDTDLQMLYDIALWDFSIDPELRSNAYYALVEYVEENYGIDWAEYYDWDEYRALYG